MSVTAGTGMVSLVLFKIEGLNCPASIHTWWLNIPKADFQPVLSPYSGMICGSNKFLVLPFQGEEEGP